MNEELRREIRQKQVHISLGGFIAKEALKNMTDTINTLCSSICKDREVAASKIFIQTTRVVRQSLRYYVEEEDGDLADYMEWFATVSADSFVEESKLPDHYELGTHTDKESMAMEHLFPMERFIVKAALDMETRDPKIISGLLGWSEKRTKKAVKMTFDKYDYEYANIVREK